MTWSMRSKLDPLASVSQKKRHLHRLELLLNVCEIRRNCLSCKWRKEKVRRHFFQRGSMVSSCPCVLQSFVNFPLSTDLFKKAQNVISLSIMGIYIYISSFSMCIGGSTEVFLLISVFYDPLWWTSSVYLPLEFQTFILLTMSNFTCATTAPWVTCFNRFRILTKESQLRVFPFISSSICMNTNSRGLRTDKSHRHTALTDSKPIAHFSSYYHLQYTLKDISNYIARTVYSLSSAGWCCFCNQVTNQQQQQCAPNIRNIGF